MSDREKDLEKAVLFFNRELLNLKGGERLLIYVDQGDNYHFAKVVQECAQEIGAHAELYELNSDSRFPEMVRDLTSKIEKGAFDVICELAEQIFYQTSVWKRAVELGTQVYSLAGIEADAFIRCIGQVNHDLMFQFGVTLRGILKKAKSVEILTGKGTNRL